MPEYLQIAVESFGYDPGLYRYEEGSCAGTILTLSEEVALHRIPLKNYRYVATFFPLILHFRTRRGRNTCGLLYTCSSISLMAVVGYPHWVPRFGGFLAFVRNPTYELEF